MHFEGRMSAEHPGKSPILALAEHVQALYRDANVADFTSRCRSWSGKTCIIQIMKRHPSHKDLQVDGRGDLAKLAEDHVRTRPGSVLGKSWL